MEIVCPPTLITSLENKHLLIDANVIRDSASSPNEYARFFNNLKNANITLATIDPVDFELLKGSSNEAKYNAREKQINDIVDVVLPTPSGICDYIYEMIKKYRIDGSSLGITDLYLGAMLMQYKQNVFLMTRDTTDFIQNIFDLKFIINAKHNKGIFTYGIYQYSEK
jgi:predicted nucleic acid-binding protein